MNVDSLTKNGIVFNLRTARWRCSPHTSDYPVLRMGEPYPQPSVPGCPESEEASYLVYTSTKALLSYAVSGHSDQEAEIDNSRMRKRKLSFRNSTVIPRYLEWRARVKTTCEFYKCKIAHKDPFHGCQYL